MRGPLRCTTSFTLVLFLSVGCGGRTEIGLGAATERRATCENGLAPSLGPTPWVTASNLASPSDGYGYALWPLEGGDFLWLGNYGRSIGIGGITLTAEGDATFLARMSPQGPARWAKSLPTEGFYRPSLAFWQDRVMVSSTLDRPVDFGQGMLTPQGLDAVVASYDAVTGSLRWVQKHGGEGDDYGGVLAQACDGATWVSRIVSTTPQIVLREDDKEAAFYELSGNGLRAVRKLVAVGQGVLAAGDFYGKMQVGGITVEAKLMGSGFCTLLDRTGAASWARVVGGQARSAASPGRGTFYVAGVHTESWSIDGRAFEVQGRLSSYVVGFDAEGKLNGAAEFKGSDWISLMAIAPSAIGIDVVGAYTGELQIGSYHFAYQGPQSNQDIWIARLGADLSVVSAASYGGTGPDQPEDVHADPQGRLLLTGFTRGGFSIAGAGVPPVIGSVAPFVARFEL